MKFTAESWAVISALLDEALDLEPQARDAWFKRIARTRPDIAPALHRLLAAHATSETADLLARPPAFTAAVGADDAGLAASDHVGPYRLIRAIGSGGMAEVWLAERADGALARSVALKLPRVTRLRRDLVARLARERDILARLEHANIARLYDAGVTSDGLPYLAMEYVQGQPITRYCDERRLDIRARLKLFTQVLDAVQYAHANLVIHRDLKPSNILVTADGQVRLLDFGIAKLLAEDDTARETQLTQLSGRTLTPDYASPEQIKGEPLSIATDVYSSGVVLYELLVGQRPYKLKMPSAAQLELAILEAEPARPSTAVDAAAAEARGMSAKRLAVALAGDLDTIVLKALAKAPADRYATVASFAEDLQRHRDGRAVLARPASWRYRAAKFVARNRLAAGAACGIALTLFLGIALTLWQAHAARTEKHRAELVKALIASILTDVDPNFGPGGRVPAAAVLQRAAQRIGAEVEIDPRVAAELSAIIGQGLMALGESAAAQQFLAGSVSSYERLLGANDPLALRLRRLAIIAALQRGDVDAAERQLPALLDALRAAGPALAEDLVYALHSMGSVDLSRGRSEAGLARYQEAVVLGDRKLGARHKATIESRSHYSNALVFAGRVREALVVAEHGAADALATYKRPHPMIAGLERRLGDALIRNDRPRDATEVLARVLNDERTVHGTDERIAVAMARHYLGLALAASGRENDAVSHLRAALETVQRLNPENADTLAAMRLNLAGALVAARRPREALVELELDATAPTPVFRLVRCHALAFAGDFAGASRELEALRAAADRLPVPHRSRLHRCAATAARLQGDLRTAAHEAGLALQLLASDQPASLSRAVAKIAVARLELGLALLESGQLDAAAAELAQARDGLEQAQIAASPVVMDARLGLARVALARGDRRAARQQLKQVVAFWQAFDAQVLGHREAVYWLARSEGGAAAVPAVNAALLASPYPLHRRWLTQPR